MSSSLLWVYSTRGWHKNTRHTRHDQVMSAKGTRVCFDTGDYHSIAVLDSGWPFAGILPLPRKLIGILLNLRQRVNPRNSDHPKSRITPLVIVEIMDTKARGILEWSLCGFRRSRSASGANQIGHADSYRQFKTAGMYRIVTNFWIKHSDDAVLFDGLRITVVQVKICQTSSYEKWNVICEYAIIYIDMYILFIIGY